MLVLLKNAEQDDGINFVTMQIGVRNKRVYLREDVIAGDANVEAECISSFDLYSHIGFDLFLSVLSKLDVKSLGKCMAVSKEWRGVAASDVLWEQHLRELWEGKIYVDPKALHPGLAAIQAYTISIRESRRVSIIKKEMCSFEWNFRFKQGAPKYWICRDPSWQGLPPMQRFFHPDGYISAGPKDPFWGGHECEWQIVDLKGEYAVQINNWPILELGRTENWGWTMQNIWVLYWSKQRHTATEEGSAEPGRSIYQSPKTDGS